MNLPNKLTVLRIILIPFILIFMLPFPFLSETGTWNTFVNNWGIIISIILFLIASITDTMDGQIARKMNLITNMGKFLDPIADKLLVASVLIALVQLGRVSAYAVIIIICREFIVSGVRLLALEKNIVIAAGKLGKIKTVFQVIAIIFEMICLYLERNLPDLEIMSYLNISATIILYIAVILTIISGYEYVVKNKHFIVE